MGEEDFHPHCSQKFFGTTNPPILDYTLQEMEMLAKQVIETSVAVPGVQPKLSMGFIKDVLKDANRGRLTVVGALGGNYILKPQNSTFSEMPENEHLTMKMAEICGITTVMSSLIRLKSGELSYITKRIDRDDNGNKIHMLDMFQILEAFDKYRGSVEKVGKAIKEHSANTLLDLMRFYEIVIFCYITGNNDMHLKNFSVITEDSITRLSPCYDLVNTTIEYNTPDEETALPVRGCKKKTDPEYSCGLLWDGKV